jgi:hypothetical protein
MHISDASTASVPALQAVTPTKNPQPEWARVPEVTKLFGIKRTHLFQLIADGRIKSASLRRRGCIKGIRIINCHSVRALLESLAEEEVK